MGAPSGGYSREEIERLASMCEALRRAVTAGRSLAVNAGHWYAAERGDGGTDGGCTCWHCADLEEAAAVLARLDAATASPAIAAPEAPRPGQVERVELDDEGRALFAQAAGYLHAKQERPHGYALSEAMFAWLAAHPVAALAPTPPRGQGEKP
jgi:hypothetical protein